jgi:hypothetical protein
MRIFKYRDCRFWMCGFILALLAFVAQTRSVPAQPAPAVVLATHAQRSHAVAKTVLGIISYTRWPATPNPLTLCVLARPVYADDLLKDELLVGSTHIVAKKMEIDDPAVATECNAVYLGTLSDNQRSSLFQHLTGHPVLSISEANTACAVGSMFCLRVGRTRVTFLVNLDSVSRSGVSVDPQVLLLSSPRQGTQQ